MVLIHPQVCINNVSINGEDLEGVNVMLYLESWIVLFVIYISVSKIEVYLQAIPYATV
jgi:hypothetical protein